MSSKDAVASTIIKYKGNFDFDRLYHLLFDTIAGAGYIIKADTHKKKEKGFGEKVDVAWSFEKEIEDYTKFTIALRIIILDFREVIIKKGDKETKTNHGRVLITIDGVIITDWKNLWEKNPVLKHLRGFYERYLFKKTLDDYEIDIYKDVFSFEGAAKAFLKLPHFM